MVKCGGNPVRSVKLIVALACVLVMPLAAQQPRPIKPATAGPLDNAPERDPAAERMAAQIARGQNQNRQERLVSDTDKLLTLATELKNEVGKTNKNVMSVDVIKKAEEIEKLAHSVKERMKG